MLHKAALAVQPATWGFGFFGWILGLVFFFLADFGFRVFWWIWGLGFWVDFGFRVLGGFWV